MLFVGVREGKIPKAQLWETPGETMKSWIENLKINSRVGLERVVYFHYFGFFFFPLKVGIWEDKVAHGK